MSFLAKISCIFLVIFASSMIVEGAPSKPERKKLLLISMDGFRYDYLDRLSSPTPNFDFIRNTGTKAPYITPTFVTKTFPTHTSLVTGLYQENHGIVGNTMWDPTINTTFKKSNAELRWWGEAVPIWKTAREQGLKTASFFWVGSEVEAHRPHFWWTYTWSINWSDRVRQVIHWLAEDGVDFATLYFNEPDHTGHKYGPFHPKVDEEILGLDKTMGELIEGLRKAGILDQVNIILTSDHGMASMDRYKKYVALFDYMNATDLVGLEEKGPVAGIRVKPERKMDVYNALKGAHPNMTVYLKEDIPERFHYKNHRRIPEIIAIADEGWFIHKTKKEVYNTKGMHGWDNELMSMKPFFLARGPNIRANFSIAPFNSVDVYPLMCELLQINPNPHNGSLQAVEPMIHGHAAPSTGKTTVDPISGASHISAPLTVLFVSVFLSLVRSW